MMTFVQMLKISIITWTIVDAYKYYNRHEISRQIEDFPYCKKALR